MCAREPRRQSQEEEEEEELIRKRTAGPAMTAARLSVASQGVALAGQESLASSQQGLQ